MCVVLKSKETYHNTAPGNYVVWVENGGENGRKRGKFGGEFFGVWCCISFCSPQYALIMPNSSNLCWALDYTQFGKSRLLEEISGVKKGVFFFSTCEGKNNDFDDNLKFSVLTRGTAFSRLCGPHTSLITRGSVSVVFWRRSWVTLNKTKKRLFSQNHTKRGSAQKARGGVLLGVLHENRGCHWGAHRGQLWREKWQSQDPHTGLCQTATKYRLLGHFSSRGGPVL